MPEIAEVARVVHHIRKHLVGKTIAAVNAPDDANVFGKVGTTAGQFKNAMAGKKVVGAGQQGKYFWMIMESPPHPVMHLGMTGWIHIRGDGKAHYRPSIRSEDEAEVWPPKFWKFTLETDSTPPVFAAFTDARRFGRIRVLDCAAEDIRNTTPLKQNGPDPVIDKDIFTAEWLEALMKRKHVPIKALLLDQANISGLGNWVGDEVMYHAKLHPEQYSDTFSSDQIIQLHKSIRYVCQTAVDLLADSSKFPNDWLFNHRWGKGKKDSPTTLPNGAKITFLTVGGRTSCVVPSVQKKTGAVAGDVKKLKAEEEDESASNGAPTKVVKSKKRKSTVQDEVDDDSPAEKPKRAPKPKKQRHATKDEDSNVDEIEPSKKVLKASKKATVDEDLDKEEVEIEDAKTKKSKANGVAPKSRNSANDEVKNQAHESSTTRRRSGRNIKA